MDRIAVKRATESEARRMLALLRIDCGGDAQVTAAAERRARTLADVLRLFVEMEKARRC